jgi:hypothetical protein
VAVAYCAVFPAGTAEKFVRALDGAQRYFVGCRVAGTQASTGFAHSYCFHTSRFLDHADCPVLGWCCVVAPSCWIARGFGAGITVATKHGRELARPVHVVAAVIGAYVVVVAHDVFAAVLSALAVCTDLI